jgi:hypothetical protein
VITDSSCGKEPREVPASVITDGSCGKEPRDVPAYVITDDLVVGLELGRLGVCDHRRLLRKGTERFPASVITNGSCGKEPRDVPASVFTDDLVVGFELGRLGACDHKRPCAPASREP